MSKENKRIIILGLPTNLYSGMNELFLHRETEDKILLEEAIKEVELRLNPKQNRAQRRAKF